AARWAPRATRAGPGSALPGRGRLGPRSRSHLAVHEVVGLDLGDPDGAGRHDVEVARVPGQVVAGPGHLERHRYDRALPPLDQSPLEDRVALEAVAGHVPLHGRLHLTQRARDGRLV